MQTPSTMSQLVELLNDRLSSKDTLGDKLKLDLGSFGSAVIDGTGEHNVVTEGHGDGSEAVSVIMSIDVFMQMHSGELDGMTAFFQGLMQVEGDNAVALKLQDLLD